MLEAVDVFLAFVVDGKRLLRYRVEVRIRLLFGVEREAVGQPIVAQRDIGRRVLVGDGARLLDRAAGASVVRDGQRGFTVQVTVSTIASSSPVSFCLLVRRTEVAACSVTTSALAGTRR